jgi:serine/threonine protein kinase
MSDEWTPSERLARLCQDQRERWRRGERALVESYLKSHTELQTNEKLLLDFILAEYMLRQDMGDQPTTTEYLERFPNLAKQLGDLFEVLDAIEDTAPFSTNVDEARLSTFDQIAEPDSVGGGAPAAMLRPSNDFGEYELIEEIARGGMGVVYKARQRKLDRIVALKMIRADQFDSRSAVLRFQNEAQAAAKLDHPGIVAIFDVGDLDGQPYLSMAYIDGEDLAARICHGRMGPQEAARIVRDVSQAIQHAHERGIVHRDLKPPNILLDASDRPRVTDFGLARRVDVPTGLSIDGSIIGTPSYMSPEQASGQTSRVGPACDIYSLGAVLFHLLTGRPPFVGANLLEIIRQVCEKPAESPRAIDSSVPVALERVCLKCLAKEPEQRYATAGAVAVDLDRYLQESALSIPSSPNRRATRRIRVPLAIIVATLVLAGALLLWRVNPPFFRRFNTTIPEVGSERRLNAEVATDPDLKRSLTAELNVIVGDEFKSLRIDQPGALPLRTGQRLRIEATTNRPAYLYLVWIDTQGLALPVYPWKPGHWELLPASEKPSRSLKFPPDAEGRAGGYMVRGRAGMETLVFLARTTPLPPELPLKALFADLPAQPIQNGQMLVWLEKGEHSGSDGRSLDFDNVKPMNNQAAKLKQQLEQRLKSHFELFRAVSLANRGS